MRKSIKKIQFNRWIGWVFSLIIGFQLILWFFSDLDFKFDIVLQLYFNNGRKQRTRFRKPHPFRSKRRGSRQQRCLNRRKYHSPTRIEPAIHPKLPRPGEAKRNLSHRSPARVVTDPRLRKIKAPSQTTRTSIHLPAQPQTAWGQKRNEMVKICEGEGDKEEKTRWDAVWPYLEDSGG